MEKNGMDLIKEGLLELKKKLMFNETTKVENAIDVAKLIKHELADGTIVYSEKDAAEGVEVFTVAEDGAKLPLVEGEFPLKDGKVLSVKLNETGLSVISKIEEKKPAEDKPADAPEVANADTNVEIQNKKMEDRVQMIENSILDILKLMKGQNEAVVKMSKQAVVEIKTPTVEKTKELSFDEKINETRKNFIASLQK